MIVVEGGDNTGKSTLVKQLITLDPSLRLLRREKFNPEKGGSIGRSYLDMLTPKPGEAPEHYINSIADRCLASECVYGTLFRGGCRMSMSEHSQVLAQLQQHKAIIAWCDPPDHVIKADWEARPQLYPENPVRIAQAYRQMIHTIFSGLTIIRYDWSLHTSSGSKAEAQARDILSTHDALKLYRRPADPHYLNLAELDD